MKIGFSFGRCVRDIVTQKVKIEDVAFIVAATAMRDEDHMLNVIEEYSWRDQYLLGLDIEQCKEVSKVLWRTNKILQPRLQGLHRHQQPEGSIWVDIFPTASSNNEAVKKSWEAYRFMLHMVENVDLEATETFR